MDNILFQDEFLALIDRDGYTFVHEKRSDGKIISLIPFRKYNNKYEYLARIEICPAHGHQPELCSITGGVDPGKAIESMAQIELLEEAGYHTSENDLISLGEARPSKSSDTTVYLFGVDLTGETPEQPIGDGSKWEALASTKWVSYEQGLQIQDPLFIVGMVRLLNHLQNLF